jgi:hypothetical protein
MKCISEMLVGHVIGNYQMSCGTGVILPLSHRNTARVGGNSGSVSVVLRRG